MCYNAMMNVCYMSLELCDQSGNKNHITDTIAFTAHANCNKINIANDIYDKMSKQILNKLSILSGLINMFVMIEIHVHVNMEFGML